MARLSKVPMEEWDDELRAATRSQIGIMPILAQVPALAIAVAGAYGALSDNRRLSKRLLELVRLRIAFRNQCRTCIAVRYGDALGSDADEGAVCALERPLESDQLSAAEKAAILFADRFAADHLLIGDQDFGALKEHFSEPEIVELCVSVAMFVGFGRLAAVLHIVENLPEVYRSEDAEVFAPWANETVQIVR
jgi:alkylhydroperoxidase family enzyme